MLYLYVGFGWLCCYRRVVQVFHVAEEGSGGKDVLLECPCQLVDVSGWVSFISCDF